MNAPKKYSSMIFLLLGITVGALVFSQFNEHSQPRVFSSPTITAEKPATDVQPARDRAINSLRDLNNAFVEIAETVNPTVVTVFTEKVTRMRTTNNPFFFFSDPFRDFFGDDYGASPRNRRGTPEREFRQQGLGSGVIVRADGYILTNNHVVAQADSIYIRLMDSRGTLPARIIGTDPRTDLAVIKVESRDLPAVKLGDSDQLRVGEWVLAIGSPLGEELASTVTQGIVSAKGRSQVGLADYEDFIQTDAAINPGNSGGALVNLDGELVGINTAIATRTGGFQGIGFAVPINMAHSVMESLIKYGKVVRGYLGVNIQSLDENLTKSMGLPDTEGALVSEVVRNTPAAKAGLQEGDIIRQLNGKRVENHRQLRNDIAAIAPGTTVQLQILRDGNTKEIAVKLGELPVDDQQARAGGSDERSEDVESLLGFAVSPVTPDLSDQYELEPDASGVVVVNIDQSSPAFRAGLREGDLVRSVNRKRVESLAQFNQTVKALKRGDSLLLQVVRRTGSFFLAFNL
ncbi:MAG: DegQ family serine endoprotease [bacterium]